MRAIDANKLIDDLYELKYTKESPSIILTPAGQEIYNSGVESAIGTILGAPTIDAVPVVRCKDCKHWGTGWVLSETEHVKCCEYAEYMVGENGYCVYGEVKAAKGDEEE